MMKGEENCMKRGLGCTERGKAGYSLVEVTLALLVVAIGLTSTFALFPEAMKDTRAAVSDTEVALFADYIFSSFAVAAAARADKDGSFSLSDVDAFASLALSSISEHRQKNNLKDSGYGHFYWISENDDQGVKGGNNWHITRDQGFWSTAFTYTLDWDECKKTTPGKNRKERCTWFVTLKVWPGEWDKIADEKKFKPYVFYREILPYPEI